MLINFVFPSHSAPIKGQYVDVRAHVENFNKEKGTFRAQASMQNGVCGDVVDIQPHTDPDYRVVTVSIQSEL